MIEKIRSDSLGVFEITDKKILYYKREFLNYPGTFTSAHIIGNIQKSRNAKSVSADITIMDCDRKIELCFNLFNPTQDDIDGVLYKLNLLKDTISEFEEVYLEKIEMIKKAQLRAKNKSRKEKNHE